jgi:hypothetical protein
MIPIVLSPSIKFNRLLFISYKANDFLIILIPLICIDHLLRLEISNRSKAIHSKRVRASHLTKLSLRVKENSQFVSEIIPCHCQDGTLIE